MKLLSWLVPLALLPACADTLDSDVTAAGEPRIAATQFVEVPRGAPVARDPEATVRAYLQSKPALTSNLAVEAFDPAVVRELGIGAVVTLQQRHHGLAVIGGTVTARTNADGSLRWVRSSAAPIPASMALDATFDDQAIVDHLAADPRFTSALFAGARVTPVIVAVGAYASAPRLAWQVDLPLDQGRMTAPRIFADAETGEVLLATDQIRHAAEHHARVFKTNPLATPERADVVLDRLPSGAQTLADESFDVYNCVDKRTCMPWPGEDDAVVQSHMCSFEKLATADATGSFAGIAVPSEEVAWADPFAEVQAYYHLRRALGVLRDRLHAPDLLNNVRYTVVVNAPGQFMGQPSAAVCVAGADGSYTVPAESQFVTLDNAAFGPLDEIPGVTLPAPVNRPTMFFGQGSHGDFSYDGGIAYHEFGHGMFHFIGSRMANGKQFPDELGMDPSQGAMDEAFADYFAYSITGDPLVGQYVGAGTPFRTAANTKRCPADMVGEEHDDSEPISGALWAIRESLTDTDRAAMDAAILTVMMAITDNDDVRTVANMLVSELGAVLTLDGTNRVRDELETRGFLSECNSRTKPLAHGEQHPELRVFKGPAVLQFQITLTEQAKRIGLGGAVVPLADGATAPTATLHIKPGADPIKWTWNAGTATSDAAIRVPFKFTATGQDSVYTALGAAIGKFPAGTYQMQIESSDARQLMFVQLSGGAVKRDGKADGDDGDDDGGGCSAGLSGALGWPMVALLGALRRRRRRT